jgi:hypothetical protein
VHGRYCLILIAFTIAPTVNGDLFAFENASPEDVATQALQALREDRMEDFAKLMHPNALRQFKETMVSIVDVAAEAGQEKQVLGLFGTVEAAEELRELDDKDVFLRFFQTLSKKRPEFRQSMAGAGAQVLGHVTEGKDLVHVVYRITLTVEGVKATKMDVISLQRTKTGWAMLLRSDIETMAAALKQRFSRTKL